MKKISELSELERACYDYQRGFIPVQEYNKLTRAYTNVEINAALMSVSLIISAELSAEYKKEKGVVS